MWAEMLIKLLLLGQTAPLWVSRHDRVCLQKVFDLILYKWKQVEASITWPMGSKCWNSFISSWFVKSDIFFFRRKISFVYKNSMNLWCCRMTSVLGGRHNIASNFGATIAGGDHNIASGKFSFVGGFCSKILNAEVEQKCVCKLANNSCRPRQTYLFLTRFSVCLLHCSSAHRTQRDNMEV